MSTLTVAEVPAAKFMPWLLLPKYADLLAVHLRQCGQTVPRTDWPVDACELLQRHSELGTLCVGFAVEHFRKAEAARQLVEAAL